MRKTGLILIVCILSACETRKTAVDPGEEGLTTGALYNSDGSPASGARVKLFDISDTTHIPAAQTATDAQGQYALSEVPDGTYNIWSDKDGFVTVQDSVFITSGSNTLKNDTLRKSGSITAVIGMEPNDDTRSAYAQMLGSEHYAENIDAGGHFTIKGLPTGAYTMRINSTKPDYTPTFYRVDARAGHADTLKDTLKLIYTGIPVVLGISAAYDTLKGVVRLSWKKPAYGRLQDFVLFKDEYLSSEKTKLPFGILDTFFVDTIYRKDAEQLRYSFSDTNDYHYKYRVAVRKTSGDIGETYQSAQVMVAAPGKAMTVIRFSTYHASRGLFTDSASVNDTLRFSIRVENPTRGLKRVEWLDASGAVLRTKELPGDQKTASDSLWQVWDDLGRKSISCRVLDDAGTEWIDSTAVSIVIDEPVINLSTPDSRYAFGDTLHFQAGASDKYGSIGKIEWDIGNTGVFSQSGDSISALAPNRVDSQFTAKLRVTDDDGNIAIDSIKVSIDLYVPVKTAQTFPARYGHASVIFKNRIWVIGGSRSDKETGVSYLNDVWSSEDGATWTQATASAPFSVRAYFTSMVYQDKIWIMCGRTHDPFNGKNDVWSSPDGINWTQATDQAAFSPRSENSTGLVFQGKMWIVGRLQDAWNSVDGITWNQVADSVSLPLWPMYGFEYGDRLWAPGFVNGAGEKVYTSADGIHWEDSGIRHFFGGINTGKPVIIYDNHIWKPNEGLYSSDGKVWLQAGNPANYPGWGYNTSVVFKNRIYMIGGNDYKSHSEERPLVWRTGSFSLGK